MSNDNGLVNNSAKWADLGVRAMSAALLIPAVLLDVWHGGIWFELFMGVLGVLMAHEWTNIAHARNSAQFALHAAAGNRTRFVIFAFNIRDTDGS